MITYKATNTLNGRFYIGSSRNWETYEKRKKSHLRGSYDYFFHRELKNSPEAFEWETVEDSLEEPVLEQALLDMWFGKEQCYNLSPEASRPPTRKGQEHPLYGRRGENSPLFGRTWWVKKDGSKETHAFCSPGEDWVKGRKEVKESTRLKQSEKKKGYKQSPEHKGKIANSRVGRSWWVNSKGELKCQKESPGLGWKLGRKWS
jgi:hypothetical protein